MDASRRSLFAALEPKEEATPPPSLPPPPPPPPEPAPASSVDPATEARIASLERRLAETQEQAIAAHALLRERELTQRAAQRQLDEAMRLIAAHSRGDAAERQLRDELAAQNGRLQQ